MFTGIVQTLATVSKIQRKGRLVHFVLQLPSQFLKGLKRGSSIAIDGVCLTVVAYGDDTVEFDVIDETLQRTTLATLVEGRKVNFERAACLGDEIGGHLLSGHVMGVATVLHLEQFEGKWILQFHCPSDWMKYLFKKGYVAVDGVSLTVVEVDKKGLFTVHLIPETLRSTTLRLKKTGDQVNIEIDASTQAIVDTVLSDVFRGVFSSAMAV